LVLIVTYLSKSKSLTPPKERTLPTTLPLTSRKQRLNLLLNSRNEILRRSVPISLTSRAHASIKVREHLTSERIHEDGDTGAVEGVLGWT
jgi:hypothetical protein